MISASFRSSIAFFANAGSPVHLDIAAATSMSKNAGAIINPFAVVYCSIQRRVGA
jgi:hypothetical protein